MREYSASEQAMLRARQHAGFNGGAADDAPAADPLALLTDLLSAVAKGDGKKMLADLSKQAVDAKTLRDLAAKERAQVDAHSAEAARRVAADRDQIDAERKQHDAAMATERTALSVELDAARAAQRRRPWVRKWMIRGAASGLPICDREAMTSAKHALPAKVQFAPRRQPAT